MQKYNDQKRDINIILGDGFGRCKFATSTIVSGVEAMEMDIDEKRPNVADTLVDDVKVSMNLGSLMMKVIIRKRRMLSPHRYKPD